jgi:hypothetical protein
MTLQHWQASEQFDAAATEHGWSRTPADEIDHLMSHDERLRQWERHEPGAVVRYIRVIWNAGRYLCLASTHTRQHGILVRGETLHARGTQGRWVPILAAFAQPIRERI